jgi:hypothetical protein
MKKISITINIDDEGIRRSIYRKYLAIMRVLAPIPYVVVMLIARSVWQRTRGNTPNRTRRKTVAYTAKKAVFTPQERTDIVSESERVGATIDASNMHSSTLVKCANPECSEVFPYKKMGNNEQKYCGKACKDAVNNGKKMGIYHYQN